MQDHATRSRRATLHVLIPLGLVAVVSSARASVSAPPPGPPAEAFSACEGKASGDACTVQLRDRAVSGTCDTPPGESRLACRPNDMPPPGPPR
jgi:hypothetical protein